MEKAPVVKYTENKKASARFDRSWAHMEPKMLAGEAPLRGLPLVPINASGMAERGISAAEKSRREAGEAPACSKRLEATSAAALRPVHMTENSALNLKISA